ncbi:MAG: NAD(+) synthase [Bacteroidaceae bacterium]|nr:NAD(+) synthase [Bacteroidaceae bacterium]
MFGFVKVASAVSNVRVADVKYNAEQVAAQMVLANSRGAKVVVFPELSLTSSTCGDLFRQQVLLNETVSMLVRLLEVSRALKVVTIVGAPLYFDGAIYNCAVVLQEGKILGVVPKTNVSADSQSRWFASASMLSADAKLCFCGENVPFGAHLLFNASEFTFAVEIGADFSGAIPPSALHANAGAEIIFNLSAEHEVLGFYCALKSHVINHSQQCKCGYVLSSAGFGESTQDNVYPGYSIVAENGVMLAEGERFAMKEQLVFSDIDIELLRHKRVKSNWKNCASISANIAYRNVAVAEDFDTQNNFQLSRTVSSAPFMPEVESLSQWCSDALELQSEGLAKRVLHTKAKTVVLGISGGLDSTLALLVCVRAFDKLGYDRNGIIGITMPGFGTSGRTHTNAHKLMNLLGITVREVSIAKAVEQHFSDITHDMNNHDVVYENSQARERTQILMDVANQLNGMVVGTGDLSELALGWATYNGDHMSMYGVNASLPKTMMRHLVTRIANVSDSEEIKAVLLDIVDTPISPELKPTDNQGDIAQKTEDLVGPYELHDFFIYHFLQNAYTPAKIYYLAQHAFKSPTPYCKAYDAETIRKWLMIFCRRFFNQQFKRSCMPDGPQVTVCSLSPRGAWAMPTDACAEQWLNNIGL